MDNGITLVSKFPTKTWGAAHAQTVDTRPLYLLPRGLGMRLAQLVNNSTRTFFRCCLYRCKTWRTHTNWDGRTDCGWTEGWNMCAIFWVQVILHIKLQVVKQWMLGINHAQEYTHKAALGHWKPSQII